MATNFVSPDTVSPTSYVVNVYTLRHIIEQGYRMARALKHPGQGCSPSELQEGLDITNHMIDGWKTENLTFIFNMRTIVQLAVGKQIYGVGPGQDWDIERPEKIYTAGFVLNTGTPTESELPVECIQSYTRYMQIVAKNVGSSIPLVLYYQPTLPYGSATLWPIPNVTTTQMALYSPGYFQELSTVDDEIVSPKGWREMLMYNVAVLVHERHPELPMATTVQARASKYKDRVKAQQITPIYASPDPAATGVRARWYSGIPKAWTPYS